MVFGVYSGGDYRKNRKLGSGNPKPGKFLKGDFCIFALYAGYNVLGMLFARGMFRFITRQHLFAGSCVKL